MPTFTEAVIINTNAASVVTLKFLYINTFTLSLSKAASYWLLQVGFDRLSPNG